jgi:hypothetical protein
MKDAFSGVVDGVAGVAKFAVSLVAGVAKVAVSVARTLAVTVCDACDAAIKAFEDGANAVIDKATGADPAP